MPFVQLALSIYLVHRAVDAIVRGARSGEIGDGKIFITELGECIRIRSGERGSEDIVGSAVNTAEASTPVYVVLMKVNSMNAKERDFGGSDICELR